MGSAVLQRGAYFVLLAEVPSEQEYPLVVGGEESGGIRGGVSVDAGDFRTIREAPSGEQREVYGGLEP